MTDTLAVFLFGLFAGVVLALVVYGAVKGLSYDAERDRIFAGLARLREREYQILKREEEARKK